VTTDAVAEVLPQTEISVAPVAELAPKAVQDRFVSSASQTEAKTQPVRSTKTAEIVAPTAGGPAQQPAR
jgi:hypothetical protein